MTDVAPAASVALGRERQSSIYRSGVLGRRPAVPTDFAELERRAKRASSAKGWAYVAGGAGEGRTMRNNRAAFDRWAIVPRMAHGVTSRDLSVDLLGSRLSSPILLAPVGAGQLLDPDCDLHVARAAAAMDVPYVFTNQGGTPMEECAAAMGESRRWVQLYWSTDEALVDSLIQRAEAIDAGALVVTLDTTTLGWRPQDLNLGSLPFAQGQGIGQYTSDPRFRDLVRERIAAAEAVRRQAGRRGHPRCHPVVALHHPEPPGQLLEEPPLPRASGIGGGLPRHLLQPGSELGPPRHPARADQASRRTQGDPAPRRRTSGLRPRRGRHRGVQPRRPSGRQLHRLPRRAPERARRREPRGDRADGQRHPHRCRRVHCACPRSRRSAARPALHVRRRPRRAARCRGGHLERPRRARPHDVAHGCAQHPEINRDVLWCPTRRCEWGV